MTKLNASDSGKQIKKKIVPQVESNAASDDQFVTSHEL